MLVGDAAASDLSIWGLSSQIDVMRHQSWCFRVYGEPAVCDSSRLCDLGVGYSVIQMNCRDACTRR
jgi:hypothetical protein